MMIFDTIKAILKWGYEYITNHRYTHWLYGFYQAQFQSFRTQTSASTTTTMRSETETASHHSETATVSPSDHSICELATADHPQLTFVEQLRIAKNNLNLTPQATAAEQAARQTEYRKNRMCIQAASYNSHRY